jgi:membrane protein YqaA with SNARE-associated domain
MKTLYLYGRPWPEALAGAILGFQITLALALVPVIGRLIESPATAPIILAIGAVLGAIVSWWIAGRSMGVARTKLERPVVLERERRRAA